VSRGFRFRSPFLQAIPQRVAGLSAQVLTRRWLSFLVTGSLVVLMVLAIQHRAFAVDGLFRWVYWLHDHVYLPIKGYTFTLFYPFSLLWWLLLIAALSVSLVSFLGLRASWRVPHVWFTRLMLENPGIHRWILGVGKALNRQGASLQALSWTATDLWQQTLEAARRSDRSESELWPFAQAVHLAKFSFQLRQLQVVEGEEKPDLQLFNLWLETYLELDQNAQGMSHRQYFVDLRRDLALAMVDHLPNLNKDDVSGEAFDERVLISDLKYLLMAAHPQLAQHSKRYARLSADRRKQSLLHRVAIHQSRRFDLLMRQIQEWENQSFHLGTTGSDQASEPGDRDTQRSSLATWLAFLLASLSEDETVALSWMDGLDLLDFYQGNTVGEDLPNMADLPQSAHLNMFHRVQIRAQERHQRAWKKTAFKSMLPAGQEVEHTAQQWVHQLAVRPDGEA
jgi:hypothetical protein